jgi:hypothetical protein
MCAAFSPDGTRALSGSWDQTIRLWAVASGECVRTFDGHYAAVLGVAFSGDGGTAVSTSFDNTVGMWDLKSGAQLVSLAGHADAVTSVAFAGEGQTFLTASRDGTIKVWDVDRPRRYRVQFDRLAAARERLDRDPRDAEALRAFGEWYAFRGADNAAVNLLERTRAAGADVSPLALARSYWKLGRLGDARREFEVAMGRNEAPPAYLELCRGAVARELEDGTQPTTGRASTRPTADTRPATGPSPTSRPQ